MERLRYNRVFRDAIIAIWVGVLLFGAIVAFFVMAKLQYDALVSEMQPLKATVVNIDYKIHYKGPNEQVIYITYEVDGDSYTRKLETDTTISFAAGRGAHYEVGDTVEIFYDPRSPEVIAVPRSIRVGYFWLVFGLLGSGLLLWSFYWMLSHRRRFLVTQREYDEEKQELKQSRLEERQCRRANKALKRRRRSESDEKEAGGSRLSKGWRLVLILLAIPVAGFILFLLLGGILIALGYGGGG